VLMKVWARWSWWVATLPDSTDPRRLGRGRSGPPMGTGWMAVIRTEGFLHGRDVGAGRHPSDRNYSNAGGSSALHTIL